MTTLDRVFVYLGVLVAVVLAAVGFHEARSVEPAHFRFKAGATTVYVSLNYDKASCAGTSCTCSQTSPSTGMEGGLAVVHGGNYVGWITPSNVAVDVEFPPQASPFSGSTSPTGSVVSGQAFGNNGDQWYYSSVSFSGITCNNPHSLGLIMR
jgi:hypothetical protein